MRLFLDMYKWVDRNPIGDGRKQGGFKIIMLLEPVLSVGKFMKITGGEMHDKNFLKEIVVSRYGMLVFHKAYDLLSQFTQWTAYDVLLYPARNSIRLFQGAYFFLTDLTIVGY